MSDTHLIMKDNKGHKWIVCYDDPIFKVYLKCIECKYKLYYKISFINTVIKYYKNYNTMMLVTSITCNDVVVDNIIK